MSTIVFLALSMLALATTVYAQSSAVVRPEPLSVGLAPGAEGDVALMFENANELYGLEVHLSFDPALVRVVDADSDKPGVQVEAAGWLQAGFVAVNQVDNASGRIDFAATLLNPAPPVSGSRNFATIKFKAQQEGISSLSIDQAILAKRDADVIDCQVQSGLVAVSAKGEAPAISTEPTPGADVARSPLPDVPGVAVPVCVAALCIGASLVALVVLVFVLIVRRRPGG